MIRIPIPENLVFVPLLAGALLVVLILTARELGRPRPGGPKHRGEHATVTGGHPAKNGLAAAGPSSPRTEAGGRHALPCADDDPDAVWTMALPAYRPRTSREEVSA